jgi:hypothetical protein
MNLRLWPTIALAVALSRNVFAAGSYGADAAQGEEPPVVKVEVEYLSDAVTDLKDAVGSVSHSDNDIHAKAASLFGRIPVAATVNAGGARLRGWSKPKVHTAQYLNGPEREDVSVEGMSDSVFNTLSSRRVPPPSELTEAYLHGENMEAAGLKNYDGQTMLGNGQLGVYMYKGAEQVGIYFNKMMRLVQEYAGNEFAAATDVHESAHSRDHQGGDLNPVDVRYGETLAYRTEYLWLNMIDPTGEKLSWARATIGKFAAGSRKAPQFVGEYLEHLAMIRDYGNRDDFYGLVVKLGYKDGHHHPSHQPDQESGRSKKDHDDHDGHDHGDHGKDRGDHDVENAERPDQDPDQPPPLVRYVEFPG